MRLDWPALGYAILTEAALAGLATLGGPHGALGTAPWMLQLPGILLVLFVPGTAGLWWRVSGMIVVQVVLWYALIVAGRRWRRRSTWRWSGAIRTWVFGRLSPGARPPTQSD